MSNRMSQPFIELQKVYYVALCALGIPGNLFAVYIICHRACSFSKTTTIYLTALAISDTICLIWAAILNLAKLWLGPNASWVYTPWWCLSIILEYGAILCSVWIIMAFTIERYIVISNKGLKHHTTKPKNAICAVVAAVGLSYTSAFIAFLLNKFSRRSVMVSRSVLMNYTGECAMFNNTYFPTAIWLHTIISGGVPYLLILVFSVLIACRLHTKTKIHPEFENTAFRITRIKIKKSLQILLVVSFTAVALGLPRFVSECLPHSLGGVNYFDYSTITNVVPDILFMLQWFNSAINFWLFSSASSAFRQECVAILTRHICRKQDSMAVGTVPIDTLKTVFRSNYCCAE
ncbi:probable G-protein coupled receptor 139 isoform X1 [Rhincodon typus]|uniref:probable G-protein coupled receptor 139 isoform X1 n=1 Tax=Rhincodon typus TaxID=259920 RepID=UPI00202FD626|nr:probable G-protein coupled receptor 139 isoform X1 [Rhincodon typus]